MEEAAFQPWKMAPHPQDVIEHDAAVQRTVDGQQDLLFDLGHDSPV
jgi:hypothetical protein